MKKRSIKIFSPFILFLLFFFASSLQPSFGESNLLSGETQSLQPYDQEIEATLYFRFQKQASLASESRFITATVNESLEKKTIEALLSGPVNATTELSPLFPEQTQVLNTIAQDNTLLITFNSALLVPYNDEPANWQAQPYWQKEVPLRRKLAMDSLVATICESFRYDKVQVLVEPSLANSDSMRLQNSYFLDSSLLNGTAPLFTYQSRYLLTPVATAESILIAWQQRDWESLYPFVSLKDHWDLSFRPSFEDICTQWVSSPTLIDYHLSSPSSSANGQHCFFSFSCQFQPSPEDRVKSKDTVFRLIRENGIWKISFSDLGQIMEYPVLHEGGNQP